MSTPRCPTRLAWRLAWALAAPGLALAGCQSLGYYAQSVNGHLHIMNAARPVDDWLTDPTTPLALAARLRLAQQLRTYASAVLHLPDNASYRRYADLGRPAVVWNVAAAPADALTLRRWCYPVGGCLPYRGYFDPAQAQAEGERLAAQGWEVVVYPVPAYSTLGWLNWLGGDPLLSTFIGYPEGDLAGLLFHELAHQRVYVAGDAAFSESYATAVERLGVQAWLQQRPPAVREAWQRGQVHRAQMRALQQHTREALAELYARTDLPTEARQARKAALMADFRARYADLKARWAAQGEPDTRWDGWVARANNASFGLLQVYREWVSAFEALFAQQDCDWPRFHAAVATLAREPLARREARLQVLQDGSTATSCATGGPDPSGSAQ